MSSTRLGEHFFRYEYGRLVATLARRVGVRHLEDVEDAVQEALLRAVETWPLAGEPDVPEAWLYRVASNRLLDVLRTGIRRAELLTGLQSEAIDATDPTFEREIRDDLLRMLFVCCDEAIPADSQLVFALKTLCGFNVPEIAQRLFLSDANVYKRLSRARDKLRERPTLFELNEVDFATRLPAVLDVLYVLFTEGYLSSADVAIRQELCDEALRLGNILAEHPLGSTTQTYALLALINLHRARMTSRQQGDALLLLEEQDRELWDREQIRLGLSWLAKSADGDTVTRYHAEAGIAAEHCLAPGFGQTRWDKIAAYYELLQRLAPSPIHRLNRALAVAEDRGAAHGLATLDGFEPPSWLRDSYLWAATMADLHRRGGDDAQADELAEAALQRAPSEAVRGTLRRRLFRAPT